MATEAPGGDVSLLWKVLYALGALSAAGFGLLWHDAKRGRKAIWDELHKQIDDRGEDRVAAERRFASKDDLDKLGERIDRSIEKSEERIMQAIRDRGPVKGT
jgi:hypothetical protein